MQKIKHLAKEFNNNPRTKYCVGIPVLNEGEKIQKQLKKMYELKLHEILDIFIFDGNSTDGALNDEFLISVGIKGILIKTDSGKQGTQLRMGFDYILKHHYEGIITIDGNNKDSVEDIPNFIAKLDEGYDFIQGSRFIKGGHHKNTPLARYIAVRLIHAPWISLLSGFCFTDTTSAYRGLSKKLLNSDKLNIFRDIFIGYELLFYMSANAPKLGYKTIEIPVKRIYPSFGKTPTKISFAGNFKIISELIKITLKHYN